MSKQKKTPPKPEVSELGDSIVLLSPQEIAMIGRPAIEPLPELPLPVTYAKTFSPIEELSMGYNVRAGQGVELELAMGGKFLRVTRKDKPTFYINMDYVLTFG